MWSFRRRPRSPVSSSSNPSTSTATPSSPPSPWFDYESTPRASPSTSETDIPSTIAATTPIPSYSPSRASSIISTGTKTSIGTLPPHHPAAVSASTFAHALPSISPPSSSFNPSEEPSTSTTSTYSGPISVLLGSRNFRITARPGSVLSISSFDQPRSSSSSVVSYPAPPYSESAPRDARASTTTLIAGTAANPLDETSSDSEAEDLPSEQEPSSSSSSFPTTATTTAVTAIRTRHLIPTQLPPSRLHETALPFLPSSAHEQSLVSPVPSSPSPLATALSEEQASASASASSSASTFARSHSPSPPDSPVSHTENELSRHYTRVVSLIDTNHQAELSRLQAAHTSALASARNSIDAAYRLELRSRTAGYETQLSSLRAEIAEREAELEDLMGEIGRLKGEVERAGREWKEREAVMKGEIEERVRGEIEEERIREVVKARNEVEDVWEGRWRDRIRLAGEEVRRLREELKSEREGREKFEKWGRMVRMGGNVNTSLSVSEGREGRDGPAATGGGGSGAGGIDEYDYETGRNHYHALLLESSNPTQFAKKLRRSEFMRRRFRSSFSSKKDLEQLGRYMTGKDMTISEPYNFQHLAGRGPGTTFKLLRKSASNEELVSEYFVSSGPSRVLRAEGGGEGYGKRKEIARGLVEGGDEREGGRVEGGSGIRRMGRIKRRTSGNEMVEEEVNRSSHFNALSSPDGNSWI